jgi:hypothetical protein
MDKRYIALFGVFILFLAGLYFYKSVSNFLMLITLLTFGYISVSSDDKKIKLTALALLFILALLNMQMNGFQ